MLQRSPFAWAALASAVATVMLAVLMQVQGPQVSELPAGWFTPVLAFEFATTPAELFWMANDAEVRADLHTLHRWDTLFPFAYAGLFACTAAALRSQNRWAAALGVFAGLVVAPADLYENYVLMGIVDALSAGASPEPGLAALPLATSIKWVALATGGLAIAWGHRTWWLRGSSAVAAVGILLAVATFHPLVCEGMGLAVLVWFATLIGNAAWGLDRGAESPAVNPSA